MVVTGRLAEKEPSYTLAEARRLIAEEECLRDGHAPLLHILAYRADGNVAAYYVECWRCKLKFEPVS